VQSIPWAVPFLMPHSCEIDGDSMTACLNEIAVMGGMDFSLVVLIYVRRVSILLQNISVGLIKTAVVCIAIICCEVRNLRSFHFGCEIQVSYNCLIHYYSSWLLSLVAYLKKIAPTEILNVIEFPCSKHWFSWHYVAGQASSGDERYNPVTACPEPRRCSNVYRILSLFIVHKSTINILHRLTLLKFEILISIPVIRTTR
jgi:hypothetical protein